MYTYQDALDYLKKSSIMKDFASNEENLEDYCTYRDEQYWKFMEYLSITKEDLDSLNIIHVAGTKGKGSTCTYIESILRANGLKTGKFLSPHVVTIRERIFINGQIITEEAFARSSQRLIEADIDKMEGERFGFFMFLFAIAIRAFIDEGVDVAIIEVCIGGEYCPTNLIPRPAVCVVTFLELDHVEILGNDIKSIAWHKSGIFKSGSTAFTSPQHPEAMDVLRQRAEERGCKLFVSSQILQRTKDNDREFHLGMSGPHQKENASLAIEVCKFWIQQYNEYPEANQENGVVPFSDYLPRSYILGLEKAKLPGRQQIHKKEHVTYYMDGAHTGQSIKVASQWFQTEAKKEELFLQKVCWKILVFCVSLGRNAEQQSSVLQKHPFDCVLFVPCSAAKDTFDNIPYFEEDTCLKMAKVTETAWKKVDINGKWSNKYHMCEDIPDTFHCIQGQGIKYLLERVNNKASDDDYLPDLGVKHIQVFVVGTFRLVGGFMGLLESTIDDVEE